MIDGVQYLSVRDIIMVMCGKDANHSNEIWRRLPDQSKAEVNSYCVNLKFKGPGQKEQPVIQFQGAVKLLMWLPGENAKAFRSKAAEILTRYYAGDKTLLKDVWANAQSASPINEAARAALPGVDALEEYSAKRQKIMDHLEEDLALVRVVGTATREYNVHLREQVGIKRELFEMEITHENHKFDIEKARFDLTEVGRRSELDHRRALKALDAPAVALAAAVSGVPGETVTVLKVYLKNKSQFGAVAHSKRKRDRLLREAGVKASATFKSTYGVEPTRVLQAGSSGFEVCEYPAHAEDLVLEELRSCYRVICAGDNQVPIRGYLVLT